VKIGLVDYGVGNFIKIKQILEQNKIPVIIFDVNRKFESDLVDTLILPGVGSFDACAKALQMSGNFEKIIQFANSGKKLIGICAGAQLLFERSEEGKESGLGLITGSVIRNNIEISLNVGRQLVEFKDHSYMGFTSDRYYFSHNYHMDPIDSEQIKARTKNNIPAFIKAKNITAIQFHPEKSGPIGVKFLLKVTSDK
jgi:glutamine amidotransferase